jgi:hypothetical protein
MESSSDDYVAIQRLAHTYSWAASKGNLDALVATFADIGILSGFAVLVGRTESEIVGRKAIRELFAGFLPGVELIHQLSQLGAVTVTANTAQADVMVSEHVRWRGQRVSVFTGYYADDLVRTADGWRYAKRTLVPRAVIQLEGDVTVF